MYIIFILWLFIILLLITLIKLLNLNKNFCFNLAISLSIILFILNIDSSIKVAINSLNLVVKTILPTIFPFTVICNLLISFDGISLYSKILGPLICKPLKLPKNCSFPIVASIICGYPLGCKYACDLYDLGEIDKNQFERILNIASNASPIFIIGAIGATMFNNVFYGYLLLISNYISPLIVGILTIPNKKIKLIDNKNVFKPTPNINFGIALKTAIENGINTTLMVGAFVIIFSIIINIIKNNALISIAFKYLENILLLPNNFLYGIFLGSIEFTNGCKLISISSFSINMKLSIISFICSFSGLSVIGQISSFTSKYNINIKKYIFLKLIQGIISFIITFFITLFFIRTKQVSTIYEFNSYSFNNLYLLLYVFSILSLIIAYIRYIIKKLHIL